ncbi:MAG: Cna B-type domain-containing protein [Lachnospiraceae bacterium]|nr:Cna B-type domain-containing protein [Lachnospiraceae bacterium]
MKFKKIDADAGDDTGLGGVEFDLYKENAGGTYVPYGSGYTIKSEETNGSYLGWVYVYGLPKGDYYLKEKLNENGISKEGYLGTKEELHFSIGGDDNCTENEKDKYVTLTIPSGVETAVTAGSDGARVGNHRVKGSLFVRKEGSSTYGANVPLDVTFTLKKEDGSAVRVTGDASEYVYANTGGSEDLVTDKGQFKVSGLPWGSYTLEEKTAPKGYTKTQNRTFTIGLGSSNAKLTWSYTAGQDGVIINTPVTGDVLLEKFDPQAKASINGAEFDLYRGKKADLTEAQKEALMSGQTPESDSGLVKVNDNRLVVRNGKIDSSTDSKLGSLEYGEYFFVEVKAPDGFEREADPFYQVIIDGEKDSTKNTVDCYVPVNNIEKTGKVTLKKADADNNNAAITGNALDGAIFELHYKERPATQSWLEKLVGAIAGAFGSDGYTKVNTIEYQVDNGTLTIKNKADNVTLNDDGSVTIDGLPWGDYYFIEKKAPKGYITPKSEGESDVRLAAFQLGLTADGTYVDEEGFEITRTIPNNEDTGNVEFTKVDAEDETNELAGAEFELWYSRTGDEGTYTKYENKTYTSQNDGRFFKFFSDDNTGKVSVSDLPWGHYYFLETKARDGYKLEADKKVPFEINADNANASETIDLGKVTNDKVYGDLELYKVDGTETRDENGNVITGANGLEGAEFYLVEVISDADRETVDEKYVEVTGGNGAYVFSKSNGSKTVMAACASGGDRFDRNNKLTVENLPAGTYRIYEEKAPEGYEVKEGYMQFTVRDYGSETPETGTTLKNGSANHYVIERIFENTDVQAKVRFIKVSENTDRLGGIKFYLYKYRYAGDNEEGEDSPKTGETRKIVRETVDEYTSSLEHSKVGLVEVTGLGEGMYYFEEDEDSARALGYVPNTTKYTFTVTQADAGEWVELDNAGKIEGAFDNIQVVNNTKDKGSVTLTKKGEGADSNGLAGVTFELHKVGQNGAIGTYTTEADGIISEDELAWGDYYFVETAAPAQYALPDPANQNNWHRFTIPEKIDGSSSVRLNIELGNIPNTLYWGEAELVKADADDATKKLDGAEFMLYDAATDTIALHRDKTPYGKLTTDAQGKIRTVEDDLGYGEYYFLEIKAPVGYKLPVDAKGKPNNRIYFTINRDHTTAAQVAVTFRDHKLSANEPVPGNGTNVVTNERLNGRYKLYKYEKINGTKVGIPNVTFTLEKKTGNIFNTYRPEEGGVKQTTYDADDPAKNGYVEYTDLEWGEYRIIETVPDGYKLPDEYKLPSDSSKYGVEFTIDKSHLYIDQAALSQPQAEIENERGKGKIRLIKVEKNSTGSRGELGATFELWRYVDDTGANDIKIGSYTVPSQGSSKGELLIENENLIWGEKYYFAETAVDDGYAKIDEHTGTSTFIREGNKDPEEMPQARPNITEGHRTPLITLEPASANNNTVQIVRIENRKLTKQDVELSKIADDNDSTPLSGAVFNLYRIERDGQGTITSSELIYAVNNGDGDYTFAGTSAGDGLTADLSVGAEGARTGKLLVKDLPEGRYQFDEITAPGGYKIKTSNTNFEIVYYDASEKNPDVNDDIVAYNSKISADVSFIKYAEAENGTQTQLGGVKFELWKIAENGDVCIDRAVYSVSGSGTDNEATVGSVSYSGLGTGRYYFKEVETPRNAYALGGPYYFHIDAGDDGKVVGLDYNHIDSSRNWERIPETDTANYDKVVNTPSSNGSVTIVKYESINGVGTEVPIKDVEFELYRVKQGDEAEDVFIGSFKTDAEGKIEKTDLEWGEYYFVEKSVPKDKNGNDLYVISEGSKRIAFKLGVDSNPMVKELEAYNDRKYGTVSVHKKGKSDKSLKGAEFKLYKGSVDDANYIATLTTGDDGWASYNDQTEENGLRWGEKYILVETKAPAGYVNAGTTKEFTVSKDKIVFTYDVVNTLIQGKVRLHKKDSKTKAGIPNVEFALYSYTLDEDGNYVYDENNDRLSARVTGYTYKTDSEGWLCQISGTESTKEIGPLDYGKYFFREIDATEAYVLLDHDVDFAITQDQLTVELEAENDHKLGNVQLHKTGDDGTALNGARFKLYRNSDAETLGEMWQLLIRGEYDITPDGYYETGYTYSTDNEGNKVYVGDGYLRINGLPTGGYTLEEIKAPDGYKLNDGEEANRYSFNITYSTLNAVVEIDEVVNPQLKGSVRLLKKDKDTKELIPDGAAFKLYQVVEDDPEPHDVSSDYQNVSAYYNADKDAFVTSEGKIEIMNALEWGTYYFEETEALEGYVFDENNKPRTAEFTVDASKVSPTVTVQERIVENEKIKGYVSLKKEFSAVDEDLNSLADADLSGIQFKISRQTGENTWEDLKDAQGQTRLFETDSEGKIPATDIGPLEYGTYVFEEVSITGTAAETAGYELNTTPSDPFTIESVNTVETAYEVTFLNYAISGSAHVDKTDEAGEKIPGIDFKLYLLSDEENENAVAYKTVTSTEDGVDFTDIPKGDYYFTEDAQTAEALGYEADATHYYFTISEQGEEAKVYKKDAQGELKELENQTIINTEIRLGKIALEKYIETETAAKYADITQARFELREWDTDELIYDDDELLKHVDENKRRITVEVEKGSYYFKEISPVPGYAIVGDGKTKRITVGTGNIAESVRVPLTASLTNDKIKIFFSKRDPDNHNITAQGGIMRLYGPYDSASGYTLAESDLLKSWDISAADVELRISDDASDTVGFTQGFVAGKSYVLHEANAPEGYSVTRDVVFTVNNDGSVSLSDNNTAGTDDEPGNAGLDVYNNKYLIIIMKDPPTEITISKRKMADDEASQELIGDGIGGELAILKYDDAIGNDVAGYLNGKTLNDDEIKPLIIESFAIDGLEHTITNKLTTGTDHKYILWEVSAPAGYYMADPVVFYLDGNGKIQLDGTGRTDPHIEGLGKTKLTMFDRPIEYKISKMLVGTGEFVEGATLKIYKDSGAGTGDRYGNPVYTFVTTGKEDVIPAGTLIAGASYKIVESEAPEGYIAYGNGENINGEPVIGSFTVKLFDSAITQTDGVIVPQGTTVYNDILKVLVSKQTLSAHAELKGAELEVTDENGNNILYDEESVVSDTKPALLIGVDIKTLSSESLDIIASTVSPQGVSRIYGAKLERGNTYTVCEVKVPGGYDTAEDVSFTVDAAGIIRLNGSETDRLTLIDPELEAAFDKLSLEGDDPATAQRLEGARLQLVYNDEVVAEWTSGDKPVILTEAQADENGLIQAGSVTYRKLGTGENDVLKEGFKLVTGDYVLREKEEPEGYHKAKDVPFKLESGDVRSTLNSRIIKMTDYKTGETYLEVRKAWIVPEDENDFEYPSEIYIDVRRSTTGGESEDYGTYTVKRAELRAKAKTNEPILQLTGLEKYNEAGKTYTYSAAERLPEDYTGEYTCTQGTSDTSGVIELINTLNHWPNTELSVLKRWELYRRFENDGKVDGTLNTDLIEEVTINLRRTTNAERDPENDEIVAVKKIEKKDYDEFAEFGFKFTEATQGKDEGKKLPKYDTDTRKKYDYYVTEESSENFDSKVTEPAAGTIYDTIVTNTPHYTPVNIRGEKKWSMVPANEETRLPRLRIDLYRDGKPFKSVTTGPEENWKFEFDNLDRLNTVKDENGRSQSTLYKYSLKEFNALTGREISEEGRFTADIPDISNVTADLFTSDVDVTITNTWNNEYIDLGGNKFWAGRFIDSDGIERDLFTDMRDRPTVYIDLYKAETDESGQPVRDADGKLKLTPATYENGDARSAVINYYQSSYIFKGLPKYDMSGSTSVPITYVVKERPVDGYMSSPADGYAVVFTADGVAYVPVVSSGTAAVSSPVSNANFRNTPTMLRISKIDATTRTELPGAVLRLIRVRTGDVIETWVSGTQSHYIEALTAGEEYRLEEVSAPDGYYAADPVTFTLNSDGVTQAVTMEDDPIIGDVRLEKRDADDRTLLSGAVFELRRLNGTIVNVVPVDVVNGVYTYTASVTTGSRTRLIAPAGGLTVTDLPYGTYYFTEVIAPRGYELNTRPEIFSVSEATASRPEVLRTSRDYRYSSVTFLDRKKTGSVELYKASGDSSNFEASLAGAVFGLYSATPRRTTAAIASSIYADAFYEYGTYVTDRYGRIRVDGLPWDRYYFIELEAPDGYVTNVDIDGSPIVYTFEVNADTVDYAPVQVVNGGYSILDYREGITPPPLPPITRVPIVPPPTPIVLGERLTPTPVVRAATPVPTRTATPVPTQAGVLGERRVKNESPIQGVLGVRSAPEQGVLGERVGPATGDAANIALWLIILLASIGAIIAVFVQSSKRKKAK